MFLEKLAPQILIKLMKHKTSKSQDITFYNQLNTTSLPVIVIHMLYCRRGKGCCVTSMWKVELELEFNFLSRSVFLSRLVRQVISVPFVV